MRVNQRPCSAVGGERGTHRLATTKKKTPLTKERGFVYSIKSNGRRKDYSFTSYTASITSSSFFFPSPPTPAPAAPPAVARSLPGPGPAPPPPGPPGPPAPPPPP